MPGNRCREAIEAHLPHVPDQLGEVIVLQCDKQAGHSGLHAAETATATWRKA